MLKLLIFLSLFSFACQYSGNVVLYNTNTSEDLLDTIPANAYYAKSNGNGFYYNVRSKGDPYPEIEDNDVFLYGDYIYRYDAALNGWTVAQALIDSPEERASDGNKPVFANFPFHNKTTSTLDIIEHTVNGKPVVNISGLFSNNNYLTNLANDFFIPPGVTDMSKAFSGCAALKSLPEGFTIPPGVTDMHETFKKCSSLKSLPKSFTIPHGVTDMGGTFSDCYSLKSLPENFTIPHGVTDMNETFYRCHALTSLPEGFTIPPGVTDMDYTFFNCEQLQGTIHIEITNLSAHEYSFRYAGTYGTGIVLIGNGSNNDLLNELVATNTDKNNDLIGKVTIQQ